MADNKLVIQLLVKDEVTSQLNRLGRESQKTSASVRKNFTDMAVKVAAFVMAVKAAAAAFNTFTSAASKVEQLSIRLRQALGDISEANKLFEDMKDLVSTMPVQFDEVFESVTTLAAVAKGGADEVRKLIPIILDIHAQTGLAVREVTSNMIRVMSSGIASADLFRDAGVRAMIGFKEGVKYNGKESMDFIYNTWENGTSSLVGAIDGLRDSWEGRTAEMSDAWFLFRAEFGKFIIDSELVQGAIKSIAETLSDLAEQLEKNREEGKGLVQTYFEMLTPLGMLINGISELHMTQEEQVAAMIEGNERGVETLNSLVEKTQELVDKNAEAGAVMTDTMEKSAKKIESSLRAAFVDPLADFISGSKKASEALADLGKSLIGIISNYVAEMIISKTIGQAIQRAAVVASMADAAALAAAWQPAAVFASIATAGGAAAAGAAGIGSAFVTSSLLSKAAQATAMAEGGIVTRPTLALIGEAGPEAVVPLNKGGGTFGDVNIFIQGGINPGGSSIDEMAEQLGFAFEREVRTARGI